MADPRDPSSPHQVNSDHFPFFRKVSYVIVIGRSNSNFDWQKPAFFCLRMWSIMREIHRFHLRTRAFQTAQEILHHQTRLIDATTQKLRRRQLIYSFPIQYPLNNRSSCLGLAWQYIWDDFHKEQYEQNRRKQILKQCCRRKTQKCDGSLGRPETQKPTLSSSMAAVCSRWTRTSRTFSDRCTRSSWGNEINWIWLGFIPPAPPTIDGGLAARWRRPLLPSGLITTCRRSRPPPPPDTPPPTPPETVVDPPKPNDAPPPGPRYRPEAVAVRHGSKSGRQATADRTEQSESWRRRLFSLEPPTESWKQNKKQNKNLFGFYGFTLICCRWAANRLNDTRMCCDSLFVRRNKNSVSSSASTNVPYSVYASYWR